MGEDHGEKYDTDTRQRKKGKKINLPEQVSCTHRVRPDKPAMSQKRYLNSLCKFQELSSHDHGNRFRRFCQDGILFRPGCRH